MSTHSGGGNMTTTDALTGFPGFQRWETNTVSTTFGYDTHASKFTQTVQVRRDDSFALKPLTFTEGPFKGRHVLMFVPITESFRFMDLPPELRTRVYTFILRSTWPIFATAPERKKKGGPGASMRKHLIHGVVCVRRRHERSEGYSRVMRGAAILRVSKVINQEIAPMLYGASTYNFTATSHFKTFAAGLGSMLGFLRHVKFVNRALSKSSFRSACSALKKATSLCSLTIVYEVEAYGPGAGSTLVLGQVGRMSYMDWTIANINELFADLLPLVKAQHALQKKQAKARIPRIEGRPEAVDIFQLERATCSRCAAGPDLLKGHHCTILMCTDTSRRRLKSDQAYSEELRLVLKNRFKRELGC